MSPPRHMFDPFPTPYAPIPGTTPAPRALFVDRWGTLLEAPERGWCERPDEVRFYPGALEALFRAGQAGWRVYLLGNEDEVAYGHLAPDAWERVEEEILRRVHEAGVPLAGHHAATTRPDGVEGRIGDSVYLLPNTGAFFQAAHRDGVDLAKSWVIGDGSLELVAGWRSGCRMAAVRTGQALSDGIYEVDPEIVAEDLAGVVAVLLETARLSA